MPPKVIEEEEIEESIRPLTKREKRRLKYRALVAHLSRKEQERTQRELDEEYGEDFTEEETADEPVDIPSAWMRRLSAAMSMSRSFLLKSSSGQMGSKSLRGRSSRRLVVDEPLNSKRYISQDRLQRMEARKNKLPVKKPKEYQPPPEEIIAPKADVVSIIDLETLQEEKVQGIIQRRIEQRKQYQLEHGCEEHESVVINSGPALHLIPTGYRKVGFLPDYEPSTMLLRKIMYLWNDPPRAVGWYTGVVITVSRLPGNNYAIKYDRYDTNNIFVDGVHHVYLSFVGEQAYGRQWVLLEPVDGTTAEAQRIAAAAAAASSGQPATEGIPAIPSSTKIIQTPITKTETLPV